MSRVPEELDVGMKNLTISSTGPKSIEDWPMITMYGSDFRKPLHIMYKVIEDAKLWNKMAIDPGQGGYMFSNFDHIRQIRNHKDVDDCGHSGASEAYALRCMQEIARNGWEKFCEVHNKATKLDPVQDFVSGTKMTFRP